MTKKQSLPVEEARKKFAELLNGSQFSKEHTAITRHSKEAGILVPPEWYEAAQDLEAKAKELTKKYADLLKENGLQLEQIETLSAALLKCGEQQAAHEAELSARDQRIAELELALADAQRTDPEDTSKDAPRPLNENLLRRLEERAARPKPPVELDVNPRVLELSEFRINQLAGWLKKTKPDWYADAVHEIPVEWARQVAITVAVEQGLIKLSDLRNASS